MDWISQHESFDFALEEIVKHFGQTSGQNTSVAVRNYKYCSGRWLMVEKINYLNVFLNEYLIDKESLLID